ncbi:MAG TPA: hypothetical protein VMF12_19450 [Xanthobacteraceae bacterium]|nr:hypothetical protein [Xanthobacteraceae bacterium]HUC64591.1 hypothetical protein [Stellaceae bacterium]
MTMHPSARQKARSLLRRHGYAVGGPIKEAIAAAVHKHERHDHKGRKPTKLKRGGAAEGAGTRLRADKPRRASGGRIAKPGTKVIIVNGHPQPVPVPVRAAAAPASAVPARPPAASPPAAPMVPRPAQGVPMAKRGGRIGRGSPRAGNAPQMTAGAKNALGRLQKIKAYGRH